MGRTVSAMICMSICEYLVPRKDAKIDPHWFEISKYSEVDSMQGCQLNAVVTHFLEWQGFDALNFKRGAC